MFEARAGPGYGYGKIAIPYAYVVYAGESVRAKEREIAIGIDTLSAKSDDERMEGKRIHRHRRVIFIISHKKNAKPRVTSAIYTLSLSHLIDSNGNANTKYAILFICICTHTHTRTNAQTYMYVTIHTAHSRIYGHNTPQASLHKNHE